MNCCPKCGSPVQEGMRYCPGCGERITPESYEQSYYRDGMNYGFQENMNYGYQGQGADEVMDQKYGMYGYSLMGTIDQYHLYRRVKQ